MCGQWIWAVIEVPWQRHSNTEAVATARVNFRFRQAAPRLCRDAGAFMLDELVCLASVSFIHYFYTFAQRYGLGTTVPPQPSASFI